MRKKIVIVVVVLLILGALSLLEQSMVMSLTATALEDTDAIMSAIRAGELTSAIEKSRALDQAWDEQASHIELLIDHGSTDDVRFALSKLIAALEEEDRALALVYASELQGGIEHVRERQELSLQNLL